MNQTFATIAQGLSAGFAGQGVSQAIQYGQEQDRKIRDQKALDDNIREFSLSIGDSDISKKTFAHLSKINPAWAKDNESFLEMTSKYQTTNAAVKAVRSAAEAGIIGSDDATIKHFTNLAMTDPVGSSRYLNTQSFNKMAGDRQRVVEQQEQDVKNAISDIAYQASQSASIEKYVDSAGLTGEDRTKTLKLAHSLKQKDGGVEQLPVDVQNQLKLISRNMTPKQGTDAINGLIKAGKTKEAAYLQDEIDKKEGLNKKRQDEVKDKQVFSASLKTLTADLNIITEKQEGETSAAHYARAYEANPDDVDKALARAKMSSGEYVQGLEQEAVTSARVTAKEGDIKAKSVLSKIEKHIRPTTDDSWMPFAANKTEFRESPQYTNLVLSDTKFSKDISKSIFSKEVKNGWVVLDGKIENPHTTLEINGANYAMIKEDGVYKTYALDDAGDNSLSKGRLITEEEKNLWAMSSFGRMVEESKDRNHNVNKNILSTIQTMKSAMRKTELLRMDERNVHGGFTPEREQIFQELKSLEDIVGEMGAWDVIKGAVWSGEYNKSAKDEGTVSQNKQLAASVFVKIQELMIRARELRKTGKK